MKGGLPYQWAIPLCFFAGMFFAAGASCGDSAAFEKAFRLYREGNEDASKPLFLKILKKNPGCGLAAYCLGQMSADGDSACMYYQIASSDKDSTLWKKEALFLSGQLFYAKENYAQSASCFEGLVRQGPFSPWDLHALLWLGRAQQKLNHPEAAESLFQQIFSCAPDRDMLIEAHFALGSLYGKEKKHGEAFPHFEKALDLNPEQTRSLIYAQLCQLHLLADSMDKAGILYEKLRQEFANGLDLEEIEREFPQIKTSIARKSPGREKTSEQEPVNKTLPQAARRIERTADSSQGSKNAPAPAPATAKAKVFWIQIGAFSNVQNANRTKEQLASLLAVHDSLHIWIDKNQALHVVKIGMFPGLETANLWAQRMLTPRNLAYHVFSSQ